MSTQSYTNGNKNPTGKIRITLYCTDILQCAFTFSSRWNWHHHFKLTFQGHWKPKNVSCKAWTWTMTNTLMRAQSTNQWNQQLNELLCMRTKFKLEVLVVGVKFSRIKSICVLPLNLLVGTFYQCSITLNVKGCCTKGDHCTKKISFLTFCLKTVFIHCYTVHP